MEKKNKKKIRDFSTIVAGWFIDGSGGPAQQDMAFEVRDRLGSCAPHD
jgi:hypothetical protein